jgi:hypothetical protein
LGERQVDTGLEQWHLVAISGHSGRESPYTTCTCRRIRCSSETVVCTLQGADIWQMHRLNQSQVNKKVEDLYRRSGSKGLSEHALSGLGYWDVRMQAPFHC